VTDISVTDLKNKHDAGEDFMLLDVRRPEEIATASIPWATVIEMTEIPGRLAELPKDKQIAVLCHAGGRSARITQFLNENGYPNAVNVAGGITAWAEQIDPTVPTY
jgi:adenylyltransferase/sulfurtransferase